MKDEAGNHVINVPPGKMSITGQRPKLSYFREFWIKSPKLFSLVVAVGLAGAGASYWLTGFYAVAASLAVLVVSLVIPAWRYKEIVHSNRNIEDNEIRD